MNVAVVDGSSSAAICCLVVHSRRKLSFFSHSSSIKALALPQPFASSSHLRRRRGRRSEPDKNFGKNSSSGDRTFEFSIDFDDISARTTANLERLFYSSKAKVHHLFSSSVEAFKDLKYSVRVERGNRIVFSCRRSSIEFMWNLFIWSVVVVLAFRMLLWLWSLRRKWGIGGWWVIRRDRSLGGREVVVGRREKLREPLWRGFKSSSNPLSLEVGIGPRTKEALIIKKKNYKDESLPKWWPVSMPYQAALFRKEEAQKEADKLVKAIMDYRISGIDYEDNDIMQLREVCRSSGVKVSFETVNACNSFFRRATDFVLNISSRVRHPTTSAYIDGEEVRQFICGLADDIRLDNHRAATLICAAVAARTRSCFLQSWAFKVQGKRSEALEELLKLCGIYQIFPPEENSPELEMVASSLSNSLSIKQRSHLLTLFSEACSSSDCLKIAAEALGVSIASD